MLELVLEPFEAGRRGKPDELDSMIAHLLGSHLLRKDPQARFDLRMQGGYSVELEKPVVHISGEISTHLLQPSLSGEMKHLVKEFYNKIHQSHYDESHFLIHFGLKAQNGKLAQNGKAGDSGDPIAVAYRGTPHYLPWERFLAVDLRDLFDRIYQQDGTLPFDIAEQAGFQTLPGLGTDGKVRVHALYEGIKLHSVPAITFALQHNEYVAVDTFRKYSEKVIRARLAQLQQTYQVQFGDTNIDINGNGPFIEGGWEVDEGSREAKPYREAFGNYGCMEDSLAGEDPSKPSGTGTFLARYIAVQIVGNELADFACVKLPFSIGREEAGLNIDTRGTATVSPKELYRWVREHISLQMNDTIQRFNLRDAALYRQIVDDSDFFHSPDLPWNKFEIKYR